MKVLSAIKQAWQQRHQLGDKSRPRELAAFLPAVLEIQETPPNPISRWLAGSLLLLLVITIIWACVGQINIIATAEGKIIPSSRIKQIQPLEKGVVKAILVNEGDYVKQGQALVELDTTLTTADKNRLASELHSTSLTLAVNRAFLHYIESVKQVGQSPQQSDQLTLVMPSSATVQEQRLHQQLLWQQWQQYWSQYQSLHSSLRKNKAEQAASQAIIRKLEKTLPIVTKRATTLENLYRKDFAPEVDYLTAEQERIQQQQDLIAERQRRQQLIEGASEVREQINTHKAQTSSTLLTQIADLQRQTAALDEEFVKATDIDDKQILYAPVAGRIQELAISTVGGVVTEAQQLMVIVPDEEQLEVEVFIDNKDIGFIHKTMPAEIKVHTFPFTKYGIIDAEISNISNDAIVDEQQGLIYSMQLRMAKSIILVDGKDINLLPGMAVTVEIQTGKRRIIEFFLAPLLRAKSESIRER